jgi:ABC-2 type transport system permease protein
MTKQYNRSIGIYTLAYKEIKRTLRVWAQSLLPSVITSMLYFVVFGKVMGSRVGTVEGFSYLSFIAPGLVMLAMINNSYSSSAFSLFVSKFMNHVEEILVSPMSLNDLFIGHIIAAMFRGLVCGFLVLIFALFLTDSHIPHPIHMIIISILATLVFSIAGVINGLYAKSFDSVSFVPTFILTPLIFLGGVFYTTPMLPNGVWRHIAELNPIYYLVDGFRNTMLGHSQSSFARDSLLFIILSVALYAIALACGHYTTRLRK